MDLTQLAWEYRDTADCLQQRIKELRMRLPEARGEDAFLLQRRVDALVGELADLRIIMTYLKQYYED